ncbi:disease resistance protein RPM1-like isoform X2 [Mercurialis annua]|uniref:disease resistance protein RPM1-like isoform X2 n=1 Tax=Mercurialis annua TaxID=3986 RepID=UPI00215FD0BA|nr:disease resistance protein RPM1-like isoform X2 [Mercurialis annua]
MSLFFFSRESDNRSEYYFAQIPKQILQANQLEVIGTGEISSTSSDFESNYEKLPDLIKACLNYCSIITFRYPVRKAKIVRLLLAASILLEIPGETMEDIIEKIIEDLIGLKMLQENVHLDKRELKVSELYYQIFLVELDEQDFIDIAVSLPVHAVIEDDGKDNPPDFKSLQIQSLFLTTADRRASSYGSSEGLSCSYMEAICSVEHIWVLDLNGKIECLPDRVGDMVHLKYLGLFCSDLDNLPRTLGNLQELQTFDMRATRFKHILPIEMLNLQQLRHILVSHRTNNGEINVPKGFGRLFNLQTCEGVYAGGGAAVTELSTLTQLKKLDIKRVSEDHSSELVAAIMKMTKLVSLSLDAERGGYCDTTLLPEMEEFAPPPSLRKLYLSGGLVEIPNWIVSMENLTTLSLSKSRLLENSNSVLERLPNLKHLNLWDAYDVKSIGKEFCRGGGFPKLENLIISSRTLVEWTQVVEGAFPSLRHLSFRNCLKLKFLPEGLDSISTLQVLTLLPAYNDIIWRLKGKEFYKIQNISTFKYHELSPRLR